MTTRRRIEALERELGGPETCPTCGRPLGQDRGDDNGAKAAAEFTRLLEAGTVAELEVLAECQRRFLEITEAIRARSTP